MSIERRQGFREVRRLLGNPKEQRPTNDQIVGALLAVERLMLIEAKLMNAGWSIKTLEIDSVIDQAEYTLTPENDSFGKALFAYRDLGDSNILPVPFADFSSEFSNQKYEFWFAPNNINVNPYDNGEKLGFYRDGSVTKMRIFPIPSEVRTYIINYAVGVQDWTQFTWDDVIQFPEFCDLLWRKAALDVVRFCEWSGYSTQENNVTRQEMRNDLRDSIAQLQEPWQIHIRHTNETASISEIGTWY